MYSQWISLSFLIFYKFLRCSLLIDRCILIEINYIAVTLCLRYRFFHREKFLGLYFFVIFTWTHIFWTIMSRIYFTRCLRISLPLIQLGLYLYHSFVSLILIDKLFSWLDCHHNYQYNQCTDKHPRVVVVCFRTPLLLVCVSNETFNKNNYSDELVDLVEIFQVLWFFRIENTFPDVEVNCKDENRDSNVDLGCGQYCQTIEDQSLDEHNKPILSTHV